MADRPTENLQKMLKSYPDFAKNINLAYQNKGYVKAPDTIFLPLTAWIAMKAIYADLDVESLTDNLSSVFISDVYSMAAYGTWKYSKGIYSFSQELFDALTNTDLPETIPSNVLMRLPDWCPYLAYPQKQGRIYGYFCYLDYDLDLMQYRLLFYPDTDSYTVPALSMVLNDKPLSEQVELVGRPILGTDAFSIVYRDTNKKVDGDELMQSMLETLATPLKLLLYLCSDEPEIDDLREPEASPERVYPKKVKGGFKLFEPARVRTWEVGKTLSKSLASAIPASGGAKSPHVRRAHWHLYWTGARNGERTAVYRWIPPIFVNADQAEDID